MYVHTYNNKCSTLQYSRPILTKDYQLIRYFRY